MRYIPFGAAPRATSLWICLLALISCNQAIAQKDPFRGPGQYPAFRNVSGLAGSGYGVDDEGNPSLDGATAFSTPTAYVLGHDHLRIAFAKLSYDTGPNWNHNHSNGKAFFTYGHTFGRFNVAVSDLFLSVNADQSFNIQVSYLPTTHSKLVPSVGIQDLLATGGSAGDGDPTDGRSSRSVFGALTYRLDTGHTPVYISAGGGNHRFSKGFASTSYQFVKQLRGWLEYDGWGFNEGVLWTLPFRVSNRPLDFSTMIGLNRGRYLAVSFNLGF